MPDRNQTQVRRFMAPSMERLEARQLLSGSPGSAALAADVMLTIRGTRAHDAIRVSLNATDPTKLDVFINDPGRPAGVFDFAAITAGIRIAAGGLRAGPP